MNVCEPDIVFLTVASDDEPTFNKSLKRLKWALTAAGVKFEATWTCRDGGWQQWLAAKAPDTDALLSDPNVSVCDRRGFFAGGAEARGEGWQVTAKIECRPCPGCGDPFYVDGCPKCGYGIDGDFRGGGGGDA